MHLHELNRSPTGRALRMLGRIGLSALFLWAALPKLADPSGFLLDLTNYRALPEPWLPPLALALPVLELLCALGLLSRPYAAGSAWLISLMLIVFAAAMAQARMRGIDLECGCFGALSRAQVGWDEVLRNVAYAVVALWIAMASRAESGGTPAEG